MKYFALTVKIIEVITLSGQNELSAGTSSMNTIDLFMVILQEDLQECRRDPDKF
jgi:hypothetical protein